MPCIWGNYSNAQIFLNVAIFTEDAAQSFIEKEQVDSNLVKINALIDTVAQFTCITNRLANKLGLVPIGKVPVHGIDGPVDRNYYLSFVGFVFGEYMKEQNKFTGPLAIVKEQIEGVEFTNKIEDFDVLLGMDVIGIGSLAVEGNGTFSFSF